MAAWYDWVTRRLYLYDDQWQRRVTSHLGCRLVSLVGKPADAASAQGPAAESAAVGSPAELKRIADIAARFWKYAYCALVFPLTVSLPDDGRAWSESSVHLDGQGKLRSRPVEPGVPPILAWSGPPWEVPGGASGGGDGSGGQQAACSCPNLSSQI